MAPNKIPVKKDSKRNRNVMNLADKLKILNLIQNGNKIASIARKFDVNESTIRSIRNNEKKIPDSVSNLGSHAKNIKIIRRNNMEKMEEMLMIWIQDLIHKKIPVTTAAIRDQATVFHTYLSEKHGTDGPFNASKGWFERFKTRFSLHNVRFTGENFL